MKKITDVLTRAEIQSLIQASDLKGIQAVGTTWGMIIGSLWLVASFPSVLTYGIAWLIMGGRQLALAILMHDASHYSLFKTRKLNDWIGTWICGYPILQDLKKYRSHHWAHHRNAGTLADPDLDLVEGFPITRSSLRRKFVRDLIGVTGLKRLYGLFLMEAGQIEYTVSSRVVHISPGKRKLRNKLSIFALFLGTKGLVQIGLFAVCILIGRPHFYALWWISYLTSFSLFIRIRSIAEHACTSLNPEPLLNTRTTYAGILARMTVAPHRVNFHLEHHLLMTVPYFQLPKLHRILIERGFLNSAHLAKGYQEVLTLASSAMRQKTSQIPN